MLTIGQVSSLSAPPEDVVDWAAWGPPTSLDLPENSWLKRSVNDGLLPPDEEPAPNMLPPPQPARARLAAEIKNRLFSAPKLRADLKRKSGMTDIPGNSARERRPTPRRRTRPYSSAMTAFQRLARKDASPRSRIAVG